MATKPFIWLDGDIASNEMALQLMNTLSKTKTNLPNRPSDWKAATKEFLQKIVLKTQRDFYKNTIHVGALKKEETIFLHQ